MKKPVVALAFVFAFVVMMTICEAFAAETLQTPVAVWKAGAWRNWETLVEMSDARQLNEEGQEWLIDLARYHTGQIDANELWKRAETTTKGDALLKYDEIGFRILWREPEKSDAAAAIRAEMETVLAGENETAVRAVKAAYARLALKRGEYATAWHYYIECGIHSNDAVALASIMLRDKSNAASVFQGAETLFENGIDVYAARQLIPVMQRAAVYAKLPAAEVCATLETIQRLYADRAVGDTDEAKAWGIVLGALRDSIAAWK